jgi:hypothetical protein
MAYPGPPSFLPSLAEWMLIRLHFFPKKIIYSLIFLINSDSTPSFGVKDAIAHTYGHVVGQH